MRFLNEKPFVGIDDHLMFVVRANLEWGNMIIEQGLDESSELLKEMECLKEISDNDVKCIDNKSMENEEKPNCGAKEIIASF